MNGFPPQLWQEAKSPDGRVYYYNTQTQATQWTKPLELMSPSERALANQPWKEYTTPEGRKYWNNTETKESSWEMPEAYRQALAFAAPPAQSPALSQFVAGGQAFPMTQNKPRDSYSERNGYDRPINSIQNDVGGPRGLTFVKSSDPEYSSFEEAEAAFQKLLKRAGVQADWTWEQTLRATLKDPQFRSIKDPKDRRLAFDKYVAEVRLHEKQRAEERLVKLRADFQKMLSTHPEIKYFSRWPTVRPLIEREAVFRAAANDEERQSLFSEYVAKLRKQHEEERAATRQVALGELDSIFRDMQLESYTRWAEADAKLQSNEQFSKDEKFKTLSRLDILNVFENHSRQLEREFNEKRQRDRLNKSRQESLNRIAFVQLLNEYRDAGKIRAGSKWKEFFPLIQDDPRFENMLGQPGSTPLELFWDILEEEERALRLIRNDIYDVLEDKRYEIVPTTSYEDFVSVVKSDDRTSRISESNLKLLHERLIDKVKKREDEEKMVSERQQRRAVDALRSRIKHLDNPVVTVNTAWETVRPRVQHLEEYKAIANDDLRQEAFDKVIKRLREREEEDRNRHRRDRADRDYDHHERNGDRRYERGSEVDAYEADRRKAIADRERQYSRTKASIRSPRHHRDRNGSAYEGRLVDPPRDRRDPRELDYRSRADPRAPRDELDYDGGMSYSTRKRESDDADSTASRKRSKRDGSMTQDREAKAAADAAEKEDVAMHSGSEEGEMVED